MKTWTVVRNIQQGSLQILAAQSTAFALISSPLTVTEVL
jgi:hypothetical protein